MGVVERVASRRERRGGSEKDRSQLDWVPLVLFGLVVFLGPLAFGAVDRIVQIGLLVVFAAGLLATPPAMPELGRGMRVGLLTLILLLIAKEFAPASWFGSTPWRAEVQDLGVVLPWGHHPEPGRAVDALLAAGIGVIWFLWVRTVAMRRSNRVVLAWLIFAAGATVSVVSFWMRGTDPKAIYGLRYTVGWMGFGPFPNRNHTADFLAMTAVMGAGCLAYAGERRRWLQLLLGGGAFAIIVAALLATQSRGGLLALGFGFTIFLALVLAKLRSRAALGVTSAAMLVVGALVLVFGTEALERFTSAGGDVSNVSRVMIWRDALGLWKQAPLFGHGAGAFASVFPLAQTLTLDNQLVLHPESSWLQWLVELGFVPLALAVVLAAVGFFPFLRGLFERKHSFFIVTAGVAAAGALLLHGMIDVPAHRWGTMLIALAALAVACPVTSDSPSRRGSRKLALVPLAIGTLWAWPFLYDSPVWSPTTLARLLVRVETASVPAAQLKDSIAWFPLNPALHQTLGVEQLGQRPPISDWQNHFDANLRLLPGSWSAPLMLAHLARGASPAHTLHYWEVALDRSGWRRDELFARALDETAKLPGAAASWAEYVDRHPELLLVYAQSRTGDDGREFFNRWWRERASAKDLGKGELETFYVLAARWGSRAQLEEWVALHPEREEVDFKTWAALLHQRGDDENAWKLLARRVPEPGFPAEPPTVPQPQLERLWRLSPENVLNARSLAHARMLAKDATGAREVLVAVARRENAPKWFREEAAHLLAQAKDYPGAVALLLDSQS